MKIKQYYRLIRALLLHYLLFKTRIVLIYFKFKINLLVEKKKYNSRKNSILVLNPIRGYPEFESTLEKTDLNILLHNFTFEKKFLSYLLPLEKKKFSEYTSKKNSNFERYFLSLYKKSLYVYLKFLKKNFRINHIMVFAIHYKSEVFWDEVSNKLGIKYLIYHRESQYASPKEIEFHKKMLNSINPFKGYKIIVYNNIAKKIFVDSGYVKNNKIIVNGPIRTDKLYNKKIKVGKKNIVLFYIIGTGMGLDFITGQSDITHSKFKNFGWNMLLDNTYKILFKLAKEFKNYKFICKGKYGGMIKRRHFAMEKKFGKTSNLIFTAIEKNYEFLKNSKLVITFGSTTMFEAMMLNKKLLIPFFNEPQNIIYKNKVPFKELSRFKFVKKNENDFYKSIKKILISKKNLNPDSKIYENCIKQYLGFNDGNNEKRFIKLIKTGNFT